MAELQRLLTTVLALNIINLFVSTFIMVCCGTVPVRYPTADNDYFANETAAQERLDQLILPKDQVLVVRLPSNTLLKYNSYKDVSILHFRVPTDTRTALFTFKAFEESKSAFQRKCKPRDVTLHLKASSYPVISPENITFPRNFLNADQRYKIYNLQFQSDETQQRISVNGPIIGNWFAIAFISWTDPNNDRIEQQGIASTCETLLLAEMSVSKFEPTILNAGQSHNASLKHVNLCNVDLNATDMVENDTSNKTDTKYVRNEKSSSEGNGTRKQNFSENDNEQIYKFFVPAGIGIAKARITFGRACSECPDVGFSVKVNAWPSTTVEEYIEDLQSYYTVIKPNQTGEISVEFYVQPNMWHYAVLKFSDNPFTLRNANDIRNSYFQSSNKANSSRTGCNNETVLGYMIVFEFTQRKNTAQEHKLGDAPFSKTNATDQTPAEPWRPVLFRNMHLYPLLRQTHREFFMFDYDLPPDVNGTVPTFLNLTAGTPAGFMFDVGEVYDIGGTLSFGVSMKHNLKHSEELKTKPLPPMPTERTGILAEKLVGLPTAEQINGGRLKNSKQRTNQTIIVCMHHNEAGVPMWPDKCRYGQKILTASAIVNNTDLDASTGLVHVPFPESGQWYVSMGLYCHGAETAARATIIESVKEFVRLHAALFGIMKYPCACAADSKSQQNCVNDLKCLAALNETETLKLKECLTDAKCTTQYLTMTEKFELHHRAATGQHFAIDNCTSSVVFSISSSPCVAGRCGRFGRCYHYMSGGFVFSTCVCMKGYRGWDCTEDTQVPSNMSILLASLFLTLSNLLFIPSIYVAAKRKYYTEAIIYFFAMFFSVFYHACDSGEDEYSFCLVKIGVLQFCDFYCGLLAIWVTLVAMAHLKQQLVSMLHMFGAILLAFGTELNKQSLWIFLAPALTGICIISISWGFRCHKTRKVFPARKYLTIWMPIGTVMVMVGLVCYAFLQTKQNYHIVHSIWHMVMALSLLCLLPSRKALMPKC